MSIRNSESLSEQGRNVLDPLLQSETGLGVISGPKLWVPKAPSLDILPGLLVHLGDQQEIAEFVSGVEVLKSKLIRSLRADIPAAIDLREPEGVLTVMALLGPGAIGVITVPNPDGSFTNMFAATSSTTNLSSGIVQFLGIGAKDAQRKWQVPENLDPGNMDSFSAKDLMTNLSAANQLALMGKDAKQVASNDPRHGIMYLAKMDRPDLTVHQGDVWELEGANGERRLLHEVSTKQILKVNEIGPGVFQDPFWCTQEYGFEEIPLIFSLRRELMNEDALWSQEGELDPVRTSDPEALATLQRIGVAVRMLQGFSDAQLARQLPKGPVIY